jgi:NAD(P)-dependent dehydrogenase (short-subunit alcohol dehydrogenase family)
MASRNEERALAAIEHLKDEDLGEGTVSYLQLDLSNPRSARQAAEIFMRRESRLDILGELRATYVPY